MTTWFPLYILLINCIVKIPPHGRKLYLYCNIWGSHNCVGGILSFLEYDAVKLVELTVCQFTSPHGIVCHNSWIFVFYADNKERKDLKKVFPLMPVSCLHLNSTSDDWSGFRDALRCTHYTQHTRPQFQRIVSSGVFVCVCFTKRRQWPFLPG